jgi:electron transfer flavoprotein beta subunit
MLKIVVCVKAVPDPQKVCDIRIDPVTRTLLRCEVPMVLNSLDKNALEAALQLKEQEAAHVTVISMGPPEGGNIVKECLALGADRGVLLSDPAFGGADAYATAFTLAKGVEKLGPFDLVLCGMASSDGATEWVGPMVAAFLDVPVVTKVKEIGTRDGEWWQVKAAVENGHRLMRVELPAVLTVTRELNTPRTLSFAGIIRSRQKEIATWGPQEIEVPEGKVGLEGSPTIVTAMTTLESKRTVKMIEGTREEKADALVRLLSDQGIL